MIEQFQRMGDFWEQRKEFRESALIALRKREGLPEPVIVDGRAYYLDESDNPRPWAIGKRKGPSIEEVEEFWTGTDAIRIEPLTVSEDGKPIEDELRDLTRDAFLNAASQQVSFGELSEPNPDFRVSDLSDESVDAAIQEHVKSHERC